MNPDPYFIDVDELGNVYVAGRNTNRIDKYDSNGILIKTWGGPGTGSGQFNDPEGIAVDSEHKLVYVTDCNNHRIQKFDLEGNFAGIAGSYGSGPGQFKNPAGIAVDQYGNVFVVDRENDRIQKFYTNGTFIFQIGSYGTAPGQFNSPESVAVDSEGNIYVGDEENNRVQKFNVNGAFVYFLASYGDDEGQVIDPEDVAVDKFNNVYVADSENSRIQRFNINGTLTDVWGGQGSGDGRFIDPRGVAIDSQGNVYVADTGNVRIQKFIPTTGTLVAACTDNRGEPLSAADIISTSQPEGQTPLQGITDENGIAEFRGVRPGAYTLETSREGQVLGSQSTEVSAGQETRSNLRATSSSLTITVLESNSPVAGAIVSMKAGGDELTQTTGLDGKVTFSNVNPGDYVVTAAKNGISIEKEVSVVEGNDNNFSISLISSPSTSVVDHFVFDPISDPQRENVPFMVKITAVDENGVKLESYSEKNHLWFYRGDELLTQYISPNEIDFNLGVWAGPVNVGYWGSHRPEINISDQISLLTISWRDENARGTSSTFKLSYGELDHFRISPSMTSVEVGKGFTIQIYAEDINNAIVRSYSGINTISATIGTINQTSISMINGYGEFFAALSTAAVNVQIKTSGNGKTGVSPSIEVLATPINPINPSLTSNCFIATATYGSELSPEVQLLRGFRDNTVRNTFAGRNFMTAFNAFYYSFSPSVASIIRENEPLRNVMKLVLYPLIDIMQLTSNTFNLLSINQELGIVTAGFVAGSLLAIVYLLPLILLVSYFKKFKPSTKLLKINLAIWLGSISTIVIAEFFNSTSIMIFSTGGFVLATICLTTLAITRGIMNRVKSPLLAQYNSS
jgi:DNA-binding beta-propeller fold protein YncE